VVFRNQLAVLVIAPVKALIVNRRVGHFNDANGSPLVGTAQSQPVGGILDAIVREGYIWTKRFAVKEEHKC
jgi:hypothetical protein